MSESGDLSPRDKDVAVPGGETSWADHRLSRRSLLGTAGGAAAYGLVGSKFGRVLTSTPTRLEPHVRSNSTGSTVTAAIYTSPNYLDPALIGLIVEYQVVSNIFDQLLWKFPELGGSRFYPGLAKSYTVSDDSKSYTFDLRQGVTFHDGTPFDANAVKYTFDRLVNPATKSINALGVLGPYQETKVLGQYTAQVIFKSPNAGFLDNLASPLLAIVPPSAASAGSNFSRHPIGSGPFRFVSWTTNLDVVLERNPDYRWGPPIAGLGGPAVPSQLVFRILTDPASQIAALETGEITVAQDLETSQIASVTASGQYKREVVTSSGMPFGWMINVQKAPTNELKVRQALAYAIDRAAVIGPLFEGLYTPAYGLFTPAMFAYNSKQFYPYDPSKAKALLESAGWTGSGIRTRDGQKLSVTWLMPVGFGFQDVAELLAVQLQEVGIDSSILQEASPGVFTAMARGAMNLAGFFLYAADPYVLLDVLSCSGVGTTSNTARYCNPTVQKQISLANATPDSATRATIYESVQSSIMSSGCFLPIYNVADVFVYPSSLKGIQYAGLSIPIYTGVTV